MKQAYPNFAVDSNYTKPIYNLNRWLEAMRGLYTNIHLGNDYSSALKSITANWNELEKQDFAVWVQYYQGNNHLKYKKANFYVNDNINGYYLPNPPNQVAPPTIPDISDPVAVARVDLQDKMSKEQRRKLMEDARKKIIGRINAAIRHLTSHEGHLLTGDEFERLLSSMYELLKQFQTVNKVSLSNQLYKDLIIRQANKLFKNGCIRSSAFLHKIAQNNTPIPGVSTPDSVAGSVDNPTPFPVNPTTKAPPELDEDDPLNELSDNLETAGLTDSDLSDDDDGSKDLNEVSLDELSVEAQMSPDVEPPAPPQMTSKSPTMHSNPSPRITPNIPRGDDLEVSLPDDSKESHIGDDIEAILDQALSNVSIKDAINRLEDVITIFKTRQLARELSMADLILNKLGMSPLFPEIAECLQKLYESTSYILTRLEKVNSQLRGTIDKSDLDLVPEEGILNPETQQAREMIKSKQEDDKKRRELRKQVQDNVLKEDIDIPNALNGPTGPTAATSNIPPPSPIPLASTPAAIAEKPTQIV